MTVELYEVFKITFFVILVIGTPLILVELYQLLRRANSVLKDVKLVSVRATDITKDDEQTKKFASDILSQTANSVIDTQVHKVGYLASNAIVKLIKK